MTRVVAVANQKGGVGKTTTAVSLGAYLALVSRVLLVDLDPQSNATSSLGLAPGGGEPSSYEALLGQVPLSGAIVPSGRENLDVLPASRALAGAQVELLDAPDREYRLARALTPELRERYDAILIDCPPSLDILTLNALVAADRLLVPVQCEYLALEGLGQLMQTLDLVRARLNPSLELLGLVLTMQDTRTNLSVQVEQEVRRHFPETTLRTVVPRSVRLSEAPSHARTVLEYEPSSRGARAYGELALELVEKGLLV